MSVQSTRGVQEGQLCGAYPGKKGGYFSRRCFAGCRGKKKNFAGQHHRHLMALGADEKFTVPTRLNTTLIFEDFVKIL